MMFCAFEGVSILPPETPWKNSAKTIKAPSMPYWRRFAPPKICLIPPPEPASGARPAGAPLPCSVSVALVAVISRSWSLGLCRTGTAYAAAVSVIRRISDSCVASAAFISPVIRPSNTV